MLFIILILIDQMSYTFHKTNYNPLEMCIVIKQIKCKSSGMNEYYNIFLFCLLQCVTGATARRRDSGACLYCGV